MDHTIYSTILCKIRLRTKYNIQYDHQETAFTGLHNQSLQKKKKNILVQCHISVPPEKSENQRFSEVFSGYRNITLD